MNDWAPWIGSGVLALLAMTFAEFGRISRKLDAAARERQQIMDAIARTEANVDWLAGMIKASDAQHEGRRKGAESQIEFRRLR